MAGCNWEKFKGGTESKAMFRHCDTERRLEATHSNADIDKSRTYMNMPFGAFEGGYENVCKAYDEYIGELDKNPGQNKRKDRVTLVGLSIPAPDGMCTRRCMTASAIRSSAEWLTSMRYTSTRTLRQARSA